MNQEHAKIIANNAVRGDSIASFSKNISLFMSETLLFKKTCLSICDSRTDLLLDNLMSYFGYIEFLRISALMEVVDPLEAPLVEVAPLLEVSPPVEVSSLVEVEPVAEPIDSIMKYRFNPNESWADSEDSDVEAEIVSLVDPVVEAEIVSLVDPVVEAEIVSLVDPVSASFREIVSKILPAPVSVKSVSVKSVPVLPLSRAYLPQDGYNIYNGIEIRDKYMVARFPKSVYAFQGAVEVYHHRYENVGDIYLMSKSGYIIGVNHFLYQFVDDEIVPVIQQGKYLVWESK